MTTQHTPTPWHAGENGNSDIAIYPQDKRRRDSIAVFAMGETDATRHFTNAQANAAFIVRCVNSHDALVNALVLTRLFVANQTTARGPDTLLRLIDDALALERGDAPDSINPAAGEMRVSGGQS